ncbi:HEPN_Apea domain-containing protein [Pseudomonas sp. IT-P171]|uniref:hypothetical protein n=1 Tax=Pseudomonas sp. IT-P171 TaxID=3026453 RepID=UPI0039E0D7F1
MRNYRVEYLAIIETKEDFCSTVEAFNSLLQAYGSIKASADNISYSGSAFDYSVQRGVVAEGAQVYFHMRFNCSKKENLPDYKKFLKLVRTILQKVCIKMPEVLWDDLSGELCSKAYPIIYELENMMRKLITKFMLISIGISWVSSAVPKEVSDSVKVKKSATQGYLYDADFIQLSNFLFKKYSTANSDKLLLRLAKAKNIQDIDLSELKEMIPQSNWERYFLPIVDCNSEYLDVRWKKIYDLRCVIAHNNFLTQEEFDEIIKLSAEVKDKLTAAIDNLDKIHVSDEQKEEVAESVVGSFSVFYGEFLSSWNGLVEDLYTLLKSKGLEIRSAGKTARPGPAMCARMLLGAGLIDKDIFEAFEDLLKFRNALVHNQLKVESHEYIEQYVTFTEELREVINVILGRQ